ncbi:Protein SOK1 [Nakaseomyces bracarensis]|uniref:Protein SOK1 n=1 Tax=Nakaseomyces bracarensis TaxID=273131 RepID=A0ABR4NSC9_9SACH
MDPRTHTRTRHSSTHKASSPSLAATSLLNPTTDSSTTGNSNSNSNISNNDMEQSNTTGVGPILSTGDETTQVHACNGDPGNELAHEHDGAGRITSSNEDDEDIEMMDVAESSSNTNISNNDNMERGITKKLKSAQTTGITLSHSSTASASTTTTAGAAGEDSSIRDYLNTSVGGNTNMSSMNNSDSEDNKPHTNSNTNIFKPFDFKTGQFLRTTSNDSNSNSNDTQTSALNTGRAHSNNINSSTSSKDSNIPPEAVNDSSITDLHPSSGTNSDANQSNTNTSINRPVNITTFMKFYTNPKTRSHSVPTILHSSLRRMTTNSTEMQNNLPFNINTNAPYHQPSNTYSGISKKKIVGAKPVNFGQVAEDPAAENEQTISTTASMKALRKAMILSQQFQGNEAVSLPNSNVVSSSSLAERIEHLKRTPDPIPLPPINLQGLKEIDLHEIMKNPQLRHDIIFDPLLQFRPNLDGERGVKKRQLSSKYWNDVENEIIVYTEKPELFDYNKTRLVPLFDTLREVLLTIVPQKEAATINNVLDTELNMQELLKGSLVMTNLAQWLAELFKRHCAPMRDAWVDKMSETFKEAEVENSLPKLIDGLRIVFQILETMKLDIANHQIRILRPALLSNAVEFEKQYFNTLMNSKRLDLQSSLKWFAQKFQTFVGTADFDENNIQVPQVYRMCIRSIISLLSCRKMVRDYPMCLSFDHARLILLRADIRQIVCLQVCRLLFQQLVANDNSIDKIIKNYIINTYTNKKLRNDIVSIITDDHGNCRWTKNTMSISVHLCKVISDLKEEYEYTKAGKMGTVPKRSAATTKLDNAKINFAKSWLCKQTQPLSDVYGVLENRIFKILEEGIFTRSSCTLEGRVKQDFVYLYNAGTTPPNETEINSIENSTNNTSQSEVKSPSLKNVSAFAYPQTEEMKRNPAALAVTEMDEFNNVFRHLYTVVNLHWSVFGQHYVDYMGDKVKRKGI